MEELDCEQGITAGTDEPDEQLGYLVLGQHVDDDAYASDGKPVSDGLCWSLFAKVN